jgi:hypothetical protein
MRQLARAGFPANIHTRAQFVARYGSETQLREALDANLSELSRLKGIRKAHVGEYGRPRKGETFAWGLQHNEMIPVKERIAGVRFLLKQLAKLK